MPRATLCTACALGLVWAATPVQACQYLAHRVAATLDHHDAVVVARLVESRGERSRMEVLRTVRGRTRHEIEVPTAWVTPCDGVSRIERGRTYLLALDRSFWGHFSYSMDGPTSPILEVSSPSAPVVEAAVFFARHRRGARPDRLLQRWATLSDSVRVEVLYVLPEYGRDEAFVPFLRAEFARLEAAEAAFTEPAEPEGEWGVPAYNAAWQVVSDRRQVAYTLFSTIAFGEYRAFEPDLRRLAAGTTELSDGARWAVSVLTEADGLEP